MTVRESKESALSRSGEGVMFFVRREWKARRMEYGALFSAAVWMGLALLSINYLPYGFRVVFCLVFLALGIVAASYSLYLTWKRNFG